MDGPFNFRWTRSMDLRLFREIVARAFGTVPSFARIHIKRNSTISQKNRKMDRNVLYSSVFLTHFEVFRNTVRHSYLVFDESSNKWRLIKLRRKRTNNIFSFKIMIIKPDSSRKFKYYFSIVLG